MSKKNKPFRPVVAISSDLPTGFVVFRRPDGHWSPDIAVAEIAETPDAAQSLIARAKSDHDGNLVVEPELIEVIKEGGFVRPASLRELIRATGPTFSLPSLAAI